MSPLLIPLILVAALLFVVISACLYDQVTSVPLVGTN